MQYARAGFSSDATEAVSTFLVHVGGGAAMMVWMADVGCAAPSFRGALAALFPCSYTHALDGMQCHTTAHSLSIYILFVAHLISYNSDSLLMVFFSPTYDSDRVSCSFLSPRVVLMRDRHWPQTFNWILPRYL
jgi:hypothetical protein